MKTKFITLIMLISLGLFFSCTKENTNPVLHPDKIKASVIVNPTADDFYILEKDNADDIMDTLSWTPADFGISLGISYVVEVDTTENDFKNAETLYAGYDNSISITQGDMNKKMIALELPFDVESTLDIRVGAVISGYDTVYSAVETFKVTPYSEAIPLYLLGNATLAGWDNNAALEMTIISTGVYEITTNLTSGADMAIKFIALLGQWAPQWGTDVSGTWDAGNLVYRPDEVTIDPPAIPAPPTDGSYIIHADTGNLTYTVTAAK